MVLQDTATNLTTDICNVLNKEIFPGLGHMRIQGQLIDGRDQGLLDRS